MKAVLDMAYRRTELSQLSVPFVFYFSSSRRTGISKGIQFPRDVIVGRWVSVARRLEGTY